ncbi:hypothetical protein GCM10009722_06360 [Williamsia deligens]
MRFTRGEAAVSVQRLPAPVPADRTPGATGTGTDIGCFVFERWGPPNPVVPVESVLLAFRGPGADGVLIDMSLADFVARPRVPAQIGVVVDGRHYQGTCTVETTDLGETRAAGVFVCPSAVLDDANPFAPDDDIAASDRSPEPETTSPPPVPGPGGLAIPATTAPMAPTPTEQTAAPSASFTGWFRVSG